MSICEDRLPTGYIEGTGIPYWDISERDKETRSTRGMLTLLRDPNQLVTVMTCSHGHHLRST